MNSLTVRYLYHKKACDLHKVTCIFSSQSPEVVPKHRSHSSLCYLGVIQAALLQCRRFISNSVMLYFIKQIHFIFSQNFQGKNTQLIFTKYCLPPYTLPGGIFEVTRFR